MDSQRFDIAIIGGGIVGLATARALLAQFPHLRLVVVEAEKRLAAHQTGNNSGVIHSGLYYKPGSLKAANCVAGRDRLYRFCEENGIAHERCGKVVVAVTEEEIPRLDELERRGRANGLQGLRRLSPEELREREPYSAGVDALLVPETGIVDFVQVTNAYARHIREAGGEVRTESEVMGIAIGSGETVLQTTFGDIHCDYIVNCAGLQCDRIARLCGIRPEVRIVPFRGEYYELVPDKHGLVKHLIYPVPDPAFPFLGVHFTRMIHGGVECGPNAVLAFRREGYGKFSFSPKDALSTATYLGFWRMARQHWRMSLGEWHRSFSKSAFVRALQRLMPAITEADLAPGGAGVRAQALERSGKLVDDFRIQQTPRSIHVLNAPSPAATASLAIGETIARMAGEQFQLSEPVAVPVGADELAPHEVRSEPAPEPTPQPTPEKTGEPFDHPSTEQSDED